MSSDSGERLDLIVSVLVVAFIALIVIAVVWAQHRSLRIDCSPESSPAPTTSLTGEQPDGGSAACQPALPHYY